MPKPVASPSARSCDDGLEDYDESDVDCGGTLCAGCGPSKMCHTDSDCSKTLAGCSGTNGGCACDALTSLCVTDQCADHQQDGHAPRRGTDVLRARPRVAWPAERIAPDEKRRA